MLSKPRLAGREAVARFFPSCAGYDHRTADRFIDWLESCGYAIVPRNEVVLVPDEAGSDQRDAGQGRSASAPDDEAKRDLARAQAAK